MHTETHRIESDDDITISLRERSATDPDTAVVFVHGATYAGRAAFDPVGAPEYSWLAWAADAGRAAFAVDIRGYGRSERPPAMDAGDESETSDVDGLGVVESGEWGDMYVALLTSTTNSVIEKHGDDGAAVDEDHFRSIDLDRHFSRTMEKYAGDSEMPPEQALVVGTLIAVGGPVALHTDLLSEMKVELRS